MSVSAVKFNILTNCTSRKSPKTSAVSLAWPKRAVSIDALASRWVKSVQRATPVATVDALYQGRSFVDAKAVANHLTADLYVVSAGLGLVHRHDDVPHYNLTVSSGPGSIAPLLKEAGLSVSDWWQALLNARNQTGQLANLITQDPSSLTLVALPATYLEMIGADLESLPDSALAKVRIFTSTAGAACLSDRVRASCLPYDDRLEGVPSYAGTKSDFPQRALRHFVECIDAPCLSLTDAGIAVEYALSTARKRSLPVRQRRSDAEIMALMSAHWGRFNGHQAPLLRFLRDEALVSCEQSRFSALWRQAKSERALS